MKIKLSDYCIDFTSKIEAKEVYNNIIKIIENNDEIEISLEDVQVITTSCSKILFGQLYIKLGPEIFYSKIKITNTDSDMRIIIQQGIKSAITDSKYEKQ